LPPADRQQQAVARLYDKLDQQVAAGTPDPAWRPEAAARTALEEFKGTQVLEVRCTSRLCRVALAHTAADEQKTVVRAIGRTQPFSEGTLSRYAPESDPRHTTLYFQRPGFVLGEDDQP
jgi:hypothetical protein